MQLPPPVERLKFLSLDDGGGGGCTSGSVCSLAGDRGGGTDWVGSGDGRSLPSGGRDFRKAGLRLGLPCEEARLQSLLVHPVPVCLPCWQGLAAEGAALGCMSRLRVHCNAYIAMRRLLPGDAGLHLAVLQVDEEPLGQVQQLGAGGRGIASFKGGTAMAAPAGSATAAQVCSLPSLAAV